MTEQASRIFPALKITDPERMRLSAIFSPHFPDQHTALIPIDPGNRDDKLFIPRHVEIFRRATNAPHDVDIALLRVNGDEARPDGTPWFAVISAQDQAFMRRICTASNHPVRLSDIMDYVAHSLSTPGADIFYYQDLPRPERVWTNSVMAEETPSGQYHITVPDLPAAPQQQMQMGHGTHPQWQMR
ncbi:MAG: hypothetical protein J0L77_07875 [Alphaproteobacteria bacterium]|nr:hypothetical protein [Alphaproteobacteria bacterium]